MKYVSLIILAVILVFAYIQFDISNTNHVQLETVDEESSSDSKQLTAEAAGFVSTVNGNVVAKTSSGELRNLRPSNQIYSGEIIDSQDGNAEIILDDGTQLTVKPKTQFRIQEFSYNANAEGNINIGELLKGQLRIITGKIGKKSGDRYQLQTKIATIGIRGTDYSARLCVRSECTISYEGKTETLNSGLYMGVFEGSIVATSKAGETEINAGEIFYQKSAESSSIQIEPIADVLFTQQEIDTFTTTGIERDTKRWIIHDRSE